MASPASGAGSAPDLPDYAPIPRSAQSETRRAASPGALAVGFSRGFLVSAGIALLALLIAVATIRVRRQDLTGAEPAPQEAAPQPATAQQHEDRAALAAAVRPCRFC
jgi:hypothetical protein